MELQIYNNNSNTNVLNKNITLVNTLDFSLKIDNSILQPVLILKNYSSGNYCYIENFKRYYYITDIKLLTGGLYQLQLDIDVLMTYKDIIMTNPISTSKIVKIPNEIDFSTLYDFSQYLMMIGG
jgi:hypothetical protein